MERKSIGMLIAALRRANGLTQKQLADRLGVSDKAVSRWERDESLPDLTLLPVIADLFHITVDELLRGERRAQADGAAEAQANADHERLKRQTRRVLNAAFGRAHGRIARRTRICAADGRQPDRGVAGAGRSGLWRAHRRRPSARDLGRGVGCAQSGWGGHHRHDDRRPALCRLADRRGARTGSKTCPCRSAA